MNWISHAWAGSKLNTQQIDVIDSNNNNNKIIIVNKLTWFPYNGKKFILNLSQNSLGIVTDPKCTKYK